MVYIANDFPKILRTAENFIDWGEGLTPSGDDFIGALLFSSFWMQEAYTHYQGFSLSDVELFVDNSRNQTNQINFTMLKDLVAGRVFDTLHHSINTLLTDQHLECMYLQLAQISI